jgi:tetratricopeptide (TPR) repeat protein
VRHGWPGSCWLPSLLLLLCLPRPVTAEPAVSSAPEATAAASAASPGSVAQTPGETALAPPPVDGLPPLEQARRIYLYARELMAANRIEAASQQLERVLQITPTWSLPKLALAQCHRFLGHPFEPREILLVEAQEVDPENHQVLYELGLLHDERDQKEQAIDCYARAIERRPDLLHARERLGLLYSETGQLDDAPAQLEMLIAAQPGNPLAISQLAGGLEKLHRVEDAEARLLQLVALAPDRTLFYARLVAFYQRQGDGKKASAIQEKARRALEKTQPTRQAMRPLASPPPKKKR